MTESLIQFLTALAVAIGAMYIGWLLRSTKKLTQIKKEESTFRHISDIPLPEYEEPWVEAWEEALPGYEAPSGSMIETHNFRRTFVSKKRGKASVVEAVQGITFNVAKGEIFGLLGPNGAGKTTTMRVLATLLAPTSGTAMIDGHDVVHDQGKVREMIGYVSQVGGMQRESTGRENILLQAKLYGMSAEQATKRTNELLRLLDIESFADRKTMTYSGGQRRIFDLASGIVHQPTLLFLDEPSTGLDPQNRVHVWEQVKKMHDAGTTIFVTTHYLEEADALCDRVAIVDQGKIVAIGTPEELKREIAGDIITLTFTDSGAMERARVLLTDKPFIRETQERDHVLHLYVDQGNENLPSILSTLHDEGITSTSVALARPTLDDVFLKLTGRSMRES